ncbi:MAG: winged-helix domain-containing protein [Candidatus Diapherotrites archaeon]|nr:BlaI/MecI/CopY family transcriptional regulator [Candidatus Micrarchaeota archaeon]MBU1939959.1 BlaI/MecI/CopY family transcriptional regulator [Candidatus Micrarchaeota archaeon]
MAAELPEAGLIRGAYTIRAMDMPPEVSMTKRSLLRWFALSFGLISEKESRSTILDVLDALFIMQVAQEKEPTSREIHAYINEGGKKISDKLLRYHLKRMLDAGLVNRKKLKYSFAHAPHAERNDLRAGFNHNVTKQVNSSLEAIETVFEKLGQSYKK